MYIYSLFLFLFHQSPITYNGGNDKLKVIAVDIGMKYNQIRCLIDRGVSVKVVPWDYDFNKEGKQIRIGM